MSIFGVHNNIKALYYIKGFIGYAMPRAFFRMQRSHYLRCADKRVDKDYINKRVDYYCRLHEKTLLPEDALLLRNHTYKNLKTDGVKNSVYFFDTYQFTRYFSDDFRIFITGGDNIDIMPYPTVVKSRPIATNTVDNTNDVMLNLNKVRHFLFIDDPVKFRDKKEIILYRGDSRGKPHRQEFIRKFIDNPRCNIGDTTPGDFLPKEWRAEKLTIRQHLDYKYIMCLEGNDVATNLKWVMSSNSVAVMPRPKYETWFMEGTLIPNYHYIEIKPDYSDLFERIDYYNSHPSEAEEIILHAHEYISQFQDKYREKLIGLKVMEKYFRMTGQL